MAIHLKNVLGFVDDRLETSDINIHSTEPDDQELTFDMDGFYALPGLVDPHVHLREPGYSYKETILSGSSAAAASGYSHIFAMPNLKPVPDSLANLQIELDLIEKDAHVHVLPYGSITIGEKGEELSDIKGLLPHVIGFSDDGRGVQDEGVMRAAMEICAESDAVVAAHCEVDSLLSGGYVHDGKYAAEHNLKGISSESEWKMIERDIKLASDTGCKYHVCHISTSESVEIIRDAKSSKVDISCETAPHYLIFTEDDLVDSGRFKMNPPIRSANDRKALIDGVLDGTIDMIATDHAPHSESEKSGGLKDSLNGIVGLETAFPVMYTRFVDGGLIDLHKLMDIMSLNARNRFGINPVDFRSNCSDIAVFDLDLQYKVNPLSFRSKGRSTPFDGMEVKGKCILNIVDGKIVYKDINVK